MSDDQRRVRQTTFQIARALQETRKPPVHQIKRIVQVCGAAQAQAWLKEVQQIEQQGGMPTSDGSGRRTPGGTYFRLVRERLIQEGQRQKMLSIFRGRRSPEEKRQASLRKAAYDRRTAGRRGGGNTRPAARRTGSDGRPPRNRSNARTSHAPNRRDQNM